MSLLDSLLDAIIRLDGDALVMRVGEKPYVAVPADAIGSPSGAGPRVELSSRVLTSAAVAAVLNRMLPPDQRAALARFGMTEYDVSAASDVAERFTIVAFRSEDDVSLEVRRRNRPFAASDSASDLEEDGDHADRVTRTDAGEGDDVMTEGELSEMLRSSATASSVRLDALSESGRVATPSGQTARGGSARGAPPRAPAQVVALARRRLPDRPAPADPDAAHVWPRAALLAAAQGATALYLTSQSSAIVRVGGELLPLEGVPMIEPQALRELIANLRRADGATAADATDAWTMYVPGCGAVRCVTFDDRGGPGLLCRLLPAAALATDQAELSPEIHALASEADGLVLVAGDRGSGRTRFLSALVDLVNRTRSDHVITVESRLEYVHDRQRAFVSQREVSSDGEALAAVQSAIREQPDVLVIDVPLTPEIVGLTIEAAGSGTLVFAVVEAATTAAAVQRMLETMGHERRDRARVQLAGVLRGIVALLLLRRRTGGCVCAREVLLNAPSVARVIVEGPLDDLAAAIERVRPHALVPFAETLAALVRNGTVHPSHAWRQVPSREPFLAALRRSGVAADVLERFA